MAEEPENLILAMLRRMDEKIDRIDVKLDCLSDDVHELKVRMSALDERMGSLE